VSARQAIAATSTTVLCHGASQLSRTHRVIHTPLLAGKPSHCYIRLAQPWFCQFVLVLIHAGELNSSPPARSNYCRAALADVAPRSCPHRPHHSFSNPLLFWPGPHHVYRSLANLQLSRRAGRVIPEPLGGGPRSRQQLIEPFRTSMMMVLAV